MEPNSIGGHRFVCAFTCDCTRHVWVYSLKSKDETFKTFKHFVIMMEKLTGQSIKYLRLDRGSEYMSKGFTDFLAEHGIQRKTSAPRTPQQNGLAERMNQTLLGGSRALLEHSGMTKGFWAKAMGTAAHILNCSPRKNLDCVRPT